MSWLETTVAALFPSALIDDRRWRAQWFAQQRAQFVSTARISFVLFAVGYIANYYLFDLPMGLEPATFWFKFRMAMAVLFLATFLFYLSPFANIRYYKLPAMVSCLILCYTQAMVAIWYGKEAWVFFFGFIVLSVMLLRMTPLNSILFAIFATAISAPILLESGLPFANLATGALFAIVISVVTRTGAVTDVRNFILNQQNIENQVKLSELSQDYANRVKSFIPRVIADRLARLVEKERLTVVEASISALKARRSEVSCLFTDIRGYTESSKDLDRFITESVMPEVRVCSDTIEQNQGIPRKVGDLIFAYFDSDDVSLNVLRSTISAFEISRVNESMNATAASVEIKRYILISSGEAIVGNFGGLDSSIEITALGTPVNLLSRIDDLTKAPRLAASIRLGDIIFCQTSHDLLTKLNVDLPFQEIDLQALGLKIRDFPEVKTLFSLRPTDLDYKKLLQLYQTNSAA